MFELENEIANWKQAIRSDAAVSGEAAIELESHLRESIAALLGQGLCEQEAFMLGANRLGHPTALHQEYAKNNRAARWRYRLFWMLAGSLGFKVIGSLVSMVVSLAAAAMAYGGAGGSVSGAVLVLVMLFAWGLILAVAYRERERLGRRSESLPLKWIFAIGAVFVFVPVLNTLGRLASVRVVGPSWYGDAAIYLAGGGFALNVFIVAVCLTALWKLNDDVAWKFD